MAVTRFAMIHSDTGQVESGANYPGCSPSNPSACDPQSFASIQDAKSYADSKGELLHVMGSAMPGSAQWTQLTQQVWQYVADPTKIPPQIPMTPAPSGNDLLIIGGAALAAFLFL